MDRKDKQKEEILDEFYLDTPEEKFMYPIDYLWKFQDGKKLLFNNNWKVNLDDGKIKEIKIKEFRNKKKKKDSKNGRR
jgi:hypothetical protein